MVVDDTLNDVETQAGAFTDLLGCEKRVENRVANIVGNARAGVDDFCQNEGKAIAVSINFAGNG